MLQYGPFLLSSFYVLAVDWTGLRDGVECDLALAGEGAPWLLCTSFIESVNYAWIDMKENQKYWSTFLCFYHQPIEKWKHRKSRSFKSRDT